MTGTTTYLKMTFHGIVPSKKNSLRRLNINGRTITAPSEKYCDWEKAEIRELRSQNAPKVQPPYAITYWVYANSRRKADLSNKIEGINDCLVKAGILEDDNWFLLQQLNVRFAGVDRQNPRIEVEIRTVDALQAIA